MYDNYHYPMGADNENSPWNQTEPPEKEFDICISQSLSKSVKVSTSNYTPYYEEETGYTYPETDNTDWREVCDECGVYTPLELIQEFKKVLEENIETATGMRKYKYLNLIKECEGWIEDEIEIVEE